MGIDWFTFVAQVVNFLILVFLLRWLLYDRILKAMSLREQQIQARLDEADRTRREADERVALYEAKQAELNQQGDALLRRAREEAEAEYQQILQKTRADVNHQREQWFDSVRREQQDLSRELRSEAGRLGMSVARRLLSELANCELEAAMLTEFCQRLRNIDSSQREELQQQIRQSEAVTSIRSAFSLSSKQREELKRLLSEVVEIETDILYEESSDVVCGIELNVDGFCFGWSVHDFLTELDLEFEHRLRVGEG